MEHGAQKNYFFIFVVVVVISYIDLPGILPLLNTLRQYVIETHRFEDRFLNSFYKRQLTFRSVFKMFKHLTCQRHHITS